MNKQTPVGFTRTTSTFKVYRSAEVAQQLKRQPVKGNPPREQVDLEVQELIRKNNSDVDLWYTYKLRGL